MSQEFYIAEDGHQTGPFTLEELKSKNIKRNTLIWTEGLVHWTKAEDIPLLKDILKVSPPPLPNSETRSTSQQAPPPIPSEPSVSSGEYFGYELARRRERFFAMIIQAIIISIPVLLLSADSNEEYKPYSLSSIAGGAILSAILGAIFYSIWGGNLGHKIMGLNVISADTGEIQRNAKTGAIREALKSVFSLFFIPAIWLLWDEDRQNIYDKVVKTYVVKKK